MNVKRSLSGRSLGRSLPHHHGHRDDEQQDVPALGPLGLLHSELILCEAQLSLNERGPLLGRSPTLLGGTALPQRGWEKGQKKSDPLAVREPGGC